MHLSIHLCLLSFLNVHVCNAKYLFACERVIVCALRHSNPSKLTADCKRQYIISQKTFGHS